MSTVAPATPATRPAKRDLTRAWVSLGLMVPSFFGLMGFGEWANAEDAPVLASAMAVVMVALYAVFAAGAVWFGVQARKLGARAGVVPAILAGLGVASILGGQIEYLLNGGVDTPPDRTPRPGSLRSCTPYRAWARPPGVDLVAGG